MYPLNERLKELRQRDSISQNQLAKKMELTRATINAWEMGISYPNAQSLIMLAKHFKVSVDYILGITNNEMVDISALNETEKRMICEMVQYLSDKKQTK
ncbi:MAG: helix-turn-helix transcriptional regulator [Ruminococcaceae bacterium]|nr:helix-turn-helix transcriptional regulator [Oscillospiraceae bacterium]